MNTKSWWQSKTIWVNLAAFVTAVGVWAQGGFGSAGVMAILLPALMPVINVILRIVTKQPLD